jgi:hypothetical protein
MAFKSDAKLQGIQRILGVGVKMKTGRNEPCPCGSGKKYKHCCYAKDTAKVEAPEPEPMDEETEDADQPNVAPQAKSKHGHSGAAHLSNKKGGTGKFRPKTSRGSQRGS